MWQIFVFIEGKWYEQAPPTSYAEALSVYEYLNTPSNTLRRVIRKVVA
jgi:hypothetical protein